MTHSGHRHGEQTPHGLPTERDEDNPKESGDPGGRPPKVKHGDLESGVLTVLSLLRPQIKTVRL